MWMEETLFAPVPHRQVVLTIPKRLRAWCLHRRKLLGDLARVAARTVAAAVLAAGSQGTDAPIVCAEREDLSLREARRRWSELLGKAFEVDP
jgi:hypothetical protein